MAGSDMSDDLTRWNRAGLSRFRYLDGNAATFLERMREKLNESFPQWKATDILVPDSETEAQWKTRLEEYYQADEDDMLWQLTRSFARACHVLGEHLDAYANEASLGTATQWDNVRKLVAMLDYHPQPPASAYTTLAIQVKDEESGILEAGFQVKHSPPDGGAPVIFESLEDAGVHSALNSLRASEYDRNPETLSGSTLKLSGAWDKLKTGTPLLLENTETGVIAAYIIQGVLVNMDDQFTSVSVSPSLSNAFVRGATRVHALPKEKLEPLGPAVLGAEVGHSLQLTAGMDDLEAGEILAIGSPGKKPVFRRVKRVHEDRLVFAEPVGELTLKGALVSRLVTVPLTDVADSPMGREVLSDGTTRHVVFAAGDWSRLQGTWVTHRWRISGEDFLPHYKMHKAKYVPVGTRTVADDEREGYTALTVDWHPDTDRVDAEYNFSLSNPQYLLALPQFAGPWEADTFLQKSAGQLDSPLITGQTRHSAAGDFAVAVIGNQCAWGKLQQVDVDLEHEEAQLTAEGGWQDRGGGPFYLSRTRVFSHFTEQLRLTDWQANSTPVSGSEVPLAEDYDTLVDASLTEGRTVIVETDAEVLQTSVVALRDGQPPVLVLADTLPEDSTRDNLTIYGNAILFGHGAAKPERVLGSGDATLSNQTFELAVKEVSFVADASQASGVRAAATVKVAGTRWQNVANLKDANSTDAVYSVRLTEDGTLLFCFGDGRYGRRLPTGSNNVRVSYRQGVGAAGNLEPGSLTKAVKPHRLVDSVSQPLLASGGTDGESSSDLRENAPATLLTLSRAVSLSDFAQLARAHASVWQARAFALPTQLGQREALDVVVVPAEGTPLTPDLKTNLEEYILAAAVPGVVVQVLRYEPVVIDLEVSVRVDLVTYDGDTVHEAVYDALVTAFSLEKRQLGQPLYRGEIYQVVEAVNGVANATCEVSLPRQSLSVEPRLVLGLDNVVRVIRPGERQCLHLAADAPQVKVTVEAYSL